MFKVCSEPGPAGQVGHVCFFTKVVEQKNRGGGILVVGSSASPFGAGVGIRILIRATNSELLMKRVRERGD